MNTDCYFEIGHSHTICQDYALTGKLNDHLSYAIISDGCSSSPLVDVGARLIAHSAREHLESRYKNCDKFPSEIDAYILGFAIILTASHNAQVLGLPTQALDCTLIISLAQDNLVRTFFYGDGSLITRMKEGHRYTEIEFESGAPFYLSYLLSAARQEAYMKEYGLKANIKYHRITNEELEETGINTIENLDPPDFYRALSGADGQIKWLAISSDGIKTYQTHDENGITQSCSLFETLKRFSDYKSFKGKFVERRMKRMKKNCEKNGITHYDDVSVATIYMGD